MRTETPPLIRLEDYRPTDYLIEAVNLDIRLAPEATRIVSRLSIRPREGTPAGTPLVARRRRPRPQRACPSIRRSLPKTPTTATPGPADAATRRPPAPSS